MNEKFLKYTSAVILAFIEGNASAAQDSLVQIQNELFNASGKEVVIVSALSETSLFSDDRNLD
jgi:hypothetical protein